MENPIELDDLGVSLFLETPTSRFPQWSLWWKFFRIFVETQISVCKVCLKKVFHSHAKRHVEGSSFTGGVNIFYPMKLRSRQFRRVHVFFRMNMFHHGWPLIATTWKSVSCSNHHSGQFKTIHQMTANCRPKIIISDSLAGVDVPTVFKTGRIHPIQLGNEQ